MSRPRHINFSSLPHPAVMQAYYAEQRGPVLSHEALLALCAERGIVGARVELGQVVAPSGSRWGGVIVLETATDVERMAAKRAA